MAKVFLTDLDDECDILCLNKTDESYDAEKEFSLLQEMCVDRLPWWPPKRSQHGN